MATQTETLTLPVTVEPELLGSTCHLFDKGEDYRYGDFRDDLVRDGFAVIKGAIPRDRADKYADQMYKWLEDFNLGFDRNDPSTVHWKNMPIINEKGMILGYGIQHEDFTWAVRQEPGVVGTFEKVYESEDLIVSFDAVGMTFPNRTDLASNNPWPHQDQDPLRPNFRCLQGLVNMLPNGPDDGGLIVCKGAHKVTEEFHRDFKNDPEEIWRWTNEWYGFTKAGLKWFEERGFKWEKVCAEPGDLIVWDSRTPHYNVSPTGTTPRFCVYTCYLPVSEVNQEDLIRKKAAFENLDSTTHWPNALQVVALPVFRDGVPDPLNFKTPRSGAPQLTERGFKLTGVPYVKA